jgi:hypothetical protein
MTLPNNNRSENLTENWCDVLMLSPHASVRDIHQAYEKLRMSYLPIDRDRSIPISPEAEEQLQKLDRAFRIAVDSAARGKKKRGKKPGKPGPPKPELPGKPATDGTEAPKKGVPNFLVLISCFLVILFLLILFGGNSTPKPAPPKVRIKSPPPQYKPAKTIVDPLVVALQQELNSKGFNAGVADGLIGPQTSSAIRAAQSYFNMPIDGAASEELLSMLKAN